jgi:hypothetical protein
MDGFPTHRHRETGDVVFPDGFEPDEIEALPGDYWSTRIATEARAGEIAGIKAEAARRIAALRFPLSSQINALREGRGDDPRFAAIDDIRKWSNEKEEKV